MTTSSRTDEALRELASAFNVNADSLIADFKHGGPCATILERMIGIPERKRGRRPNLRENWFRFIAIVHAKRAAKFAPPHGRAKNPYEAAADSLSDLDDPENCGPERMRQTYSRMKKQYGWRDEHVPDGLAALFSSPPEL